jgi:AraC-like DNA-binding protein
MADRLKALSVRLSGGHSWLKGVRSSGIVNAMDALADVFAALRVGGMIYAQSDLRAPWGLAFSRSTKAGFHVVVRGSCWLRTENQTRLELHQGDVVLLPRGWTHSLADSVNRRALPYMDALAKQGSESGSARTTRLLCGAYHLAPEGAGSLLTLLPPLVHVRADRASAELRETVASLSREAGSSAPGATAATSRLVDLLLIYVLRTWIAEQPEGEGGWLGALRDPSIARALAILHDDVGSSWELGMLARRVGLSRATLARRFSRLVGTPPLTYLARWRMTLAGRLLRETPEPLAKIASRVGYESEFAFNRAFKRELGVSPGEYRKRAAGGGAD